MTADRRTVSACIAVYNGVDLLKQAIQSILDQSVQPDEILVLDDGSTDDSFTVANSFNGVRAIRQGNSGIGAARRRLVEEAKGDWIAFCDHDDRWEPNRLQAQLSYITDPKVVLVYSGVWHVDSRGSRTASTLHAQPEAPSVDHVVPHPEDIWTSSTLLLRQAVVDAGNFNAHYRTGEDMLMWFRLAGLGKFVQVPERLVHMLRREDSTSSLDKGQVESGVWLYENEVLPNLDRWFSTLSSTKRDSCRRLLEAKTGYATSILASYYDSEGDHASAIALYRRAAKLSPNSKGVWYRYVRSLCGFPVKPPTKPQASI